MDTPAFSENHIIKTDPKRLEMLQIDECPESIENQSSNTGAQIQTPSSYLMHK